MAGIQHSNNQSQAFYLKEVSTGADINNDKTIDGKNDLVPFIRNLKNFESVGLVEIEKIATEFVTDLEILDTGQNITQVSITKEGFQSHVDAYFTKILGPKIIAKANVTSREWANFHILKTMGDAGFIKINEQESIVIAVKKL